MAFTRAAVGAKITSTMYNQLIDAFGTIGLVQVVPSAVTGGSADSTGLVTFSNAASVLLDGAFTSAYQKFKVEISLQTLGAGVPYLQLRSGGTTDGSAVYYKQRLITSSSTTTALQQLAQIRWDMGVAAFAGYNIITLELANVAQAAPTVGRARNDATPNPMTTSAGWQDATVQHSTLAGFDGLAIMASTGNISGWMKVYGYA